MAFIDFRKAYDAIDRAKLFSKLRDLGISGKMYKALESFYKDVKCSVRLNNIHTDWFSIKCGLKQGCSWSPVVFNLFINDLITTISSIETGIRIDDDSVISILAYADDVVLLSELENDLQNLFNVLKSWCDVNKMVINMGKSMIIHFRRQSEAKTNSTFSVGDAHLKLTDQYVYLGLLLIEHLDCTAMAKHVFNSANRALSLVITKHKTVGGLPFHTYANCLGQWSGVPSVMAGSYGETDSFRI